MRIIAGKFRSRTLVAPKGETTRPTTDRAREALFNVLQNMLEFDGLRVLDLFAGSGALGIEALSRGAAALVAVESDPNALEVLKKNRETLELKSEMEIRRGDVYNVLPTLARHFGLILSDAPYEELKAREALPEMLLTAGLLQDATLLVIEHRSTDTIVIPNGVQLMRTLKAGEAAFSFLQRTDSSD